jgi:probable rRNA maturation factor
MRRAAETVLRHQRVAEACELAVLLTDDETLRELNRRHRGVDEPTDVLAFPNQATGPFVDVPGLPRYLGDVIISFPRAKAQAAEAGNELSAELQLLVVHGVLHLLGYDDQAPPERARMWRAQQIVLDDLGVEVHLPD